MIYAMEKEKPMSKLTADDTVLGLAAAVCDRATELLTDGWTKGAMSRSSGGAPVAFCIHGAIELAMEETFGVRDLRQAVQQDVEQVAVAFICDEAFGTIKGKGAGIPAAAFNDASERRHQEVIDVMSRATTRLWGVTFDTAVTQEKPFEFSQWADLEEAQAKQFLYQTLN
jgi:hypothetical protein